MTSVDLKSTVMKTAVAIGAVVIIGLLIAPFLSRWNSKQLVHRLAAQVAEAEDAEVKVPLRQLATLGETAIEPLVIAAASQRAAVAIEARQIINEKFSKIAFTAQQAERNGLDTATAETADAIAASLATHIDAFGPAGKQWAERLALSMIELTDKLPMLQTQSLLENCSRVLTSVPPRGRRMRTISASSNTSSSPQSRGTSISEPKLESLTRTSEKSLEILARIAPSAQPNGSPPAPATTISTLVRRQQNSTLDWSADTAAEQNAKPLAPAAPAQTKPISRALTPKLSSNNHQVVDIPSPQEMQQRAVVLRRISEEELFLRLQDADRYEAGIIRSVLYERGFLPNEIELRLRLSTLNSDEGLRLTDSIAELPSTAAGRTWRWLLGNKSGDLRLRALSVLATTKAPDVPQLARELALNDEDPRVAKLASQLVR